MIAAGSSSVTDCQLPQCSSKKDGDIKTNCCLVVSYIVWVAMQAIHLLMSWLLVSPTSSQFWHQRGVEAAVYVAREFVRGLNLAQAI